MVVVELSQEDYESINGIRQRVLEVKKWTGYIDIVASEEIKLRTRSLFAQCQEIRAEIQDFMIHYHQSADNQEKIARLRNRVVTLYQVYHQLSTDHSAQLVSGFKREK